MSASRFPGESQAASCGRHQPGRADRQSRSSASRVRSRRATSTATPIKHVIVIIGENRTFDHIFATYKPVAGQTVYNLLSKGIVNADGTPGPTSRWLASPPPSIPSTDSTC